MFVNVTRAAGERKHTCPCCGFRTLNQRGANEICPVCLWKDDGQDDHDADVQRHGPLFDSLTGARLNFKEFCAHDLLWIGMGREPLPEEIDPKNDSKTESNN